MFLRDKELARGGKRSGQSDRKRVLQLAREQRKARIQKQELEVAAQHIQRFVRGRLAARRLRTQMRVEYDQKLSDIDQLKVILQLHDMALPYESLFEVKECCQLVLLTKSTR